MRRGAWIVTALLGCAPEVGAPTESASRSSATLPETETSVLPNRAEAESELWSLVAFREGWIDLASVGEQAFALIDGEPIPLHAGRVVERDPALGIGLQPDKASFASTHELIAFGGTLGPDATAHVVLAEHFASSGSTYSCYAREGDRWRPRELPRRGREPRIETHYAAIVETGGALLGLRRHVIRSELWDYGDDDDPDIQAALRKLGRELGELPRGFEVLAGELPRVPKLAKGTDASDAVSTSSGEIVALGYRHRTEIDGDDGPARVLSWAPGETKATIAELPGLEDPAIHQLGIWLSSDAVLIGGLRDVVGDDDQPYLAMRERDGSLTEIALELPRTVHERVASAALGATGELWIITGGWNYASEQPCDCLWRKPVGGGWEAIELPPIAPFRDAEARWAHVFAEQTWIEVPAAPLRPLYPAPRTVVIADDTLWLTAEFGPSYPSAEFVLADSRTVLFSTVPVEAPTELIATDELFDERVDRRVAAANFTPGSDDCRTFTMVVADDPDGEGHEALARLVAHLEPLREAATIEHEDAWASASMIYVGELDGRPQLVVEASAWNPKSALALADAFAQHLGRRPDLDCRPRKLIRAIERLR